MARDDDLTIVSTLRLVADAQSGDGQALDAIFTRYLPRVRLIVGARMGWTAGELGDLEDLVQESLLKALKSLDSFDVDSEGKFCNWISSCVQSAITDVARRAKAQKRDPGRERHFTAPPGESLSALLLPNRQPSPSEILSGKELEEKLEGTLLGMKAPQREIIVLRQLVGMSYHEIAEELGFEREATVRVVLSRALEELRKRLAG